MNLIQLIEEQSAPQLTRVAGQMPGIGAGKASGAVQAAIPALLASFTQLSASPSGANSLNAAAERAAREGTDLTSPPSGATQAAGEQGTSLLSSLLGEGKLSALSGAVGSFAGLNPGAATSLIGAAAPMLLGFLGRQSGATGGGLAGLLAGQKDAIMSAMPSGLSGLLGSAGVLGAMPDLKSAGREAAAGMSRSVERVAAKAESYTPSLPRPGAAAMASAAWIRPAVILGILVIVAFVVWQFVAGRSAQETAQQAAGQAQQAAQQATGAAQQAAGAAQEAASSAVAMVGGVDLGKEITGHLTKLGSVFGGITNADTARSAVPSLQDISGSVDKLKGLSAQLPASGRSALAALVAKSLPPLRSALDKANAIPGVGDVIRPVADPLMASLGELAKAPA